MDLSEEEALNMAELMKLGNESIKEAIHRVERDQHGVVALIYTEGCTKMKIDILDEPFDENVRIYPRGLPEESNADH